MKKEKLSQLFAKFEEEGNCEDKSSCRNALFIAMKPQMEVWATSVLGRMGLFPESHEISNYAWDSFLYCLERYRSKENSLTKHFYTYTRYYLTNRINGDRNIQNEASNVEDIFSVKDSVEFCSLCMEKMLDLKGFRTALPEQYRIVFDGALETYGTPDGPSEGRIESSGMNIHRHREATKIFKFFIGYILSDK